MPPRRSLLIPDVRGTAAAILLALAGCDGGGPVSHDGPIRSEASSDNRAASAGPADNGEMIGSGSQLRLVGQWAADAESCESAAWKFTDTMLSTPAGSSCSFNKVTDVPGGYDIEATCTAEGPPTSDLLKVRFGDGESMVFESDTIADRSLVSCGAEG